MSVRVSVRDRTLSLLARYLINRLWEFHQIYNIGGVGDEDELRDFQVKKVKDQVHSETKRISGGGMKIDGSPSNTIQFLVHSPALIMHKHDFDNVEICIRNGNSRFRIFPYLNPVSMRMDAVQFGKWEWELELLHGQENEINISANIYNGRVYLYCKVDARKIDR